MLSGRLAFWLARSPDREATVMSRVFAVLASTATLLVAAPAFAGPCEQLAGGRWLYHLSGGSPGQIVTGVMDFRDGSGADPQVQRGLVFFAFAPAPFPAQVTGVPLAHGSSGWGRWVQCTAMPGNVARLSRAISVDLTVSADGKSAVASGYYGGLSGWAAREPGVAATPAGTLAQRPRN